MNLIKILTDKDFNIEPVEMNNPKHRYAARGLVFKDDKIAILNKQFKREYKLVGGGIEENEDPAIAFQREVLEESGCEIEIKELLGTIEEHKSQDNFKQTSYVFVAIVVNDTKKLNLTQKELDEGARLLWLDIEDAMRLIKESEDKLIASEYENIYHTKFIVRRDYEILRYYLNKYNN